MHGGISPENLYITKTGKIKIGGLNFCTQLTTDDSSPAPVQPMTRFNEFQMYPNLKFSAPEISATSARCSPYSDLFSLGCIIYYLLNLSKHKEPFLLT